MYSRKGFKPSQKARIAGFTSSLSLTYISFMMCIPGVSENKAISVAEKYPTLNSLMDLLNDQQKTEKERVAALAEVSIKSGSYSKEKAQKIGKAVANKIYTYFMAVDPSIIIS